MKHTGILKIINTGLPALLFSLTGCVTCELTTSSVNNITQSTAVCKGNIHCSSDEEIISTGVCWSTTEEPDVNSIKAAGLSVPGPFEISIAGLSCNTTYYLRAFMITRHDTAYGNTERFTTADAELPKVITITPVDSDIRFVRFGGNVTDGGGAGITERGICLDTQPNPTRKNNTLIDNEPATGSYTMLTTDLSGNMTYFLRAYASNCKGTAYGNQVQYKKKLTADSMYTFIKIIQDDHVQTSYSDFNCFTWSDYNNFHKTNALKEIIRSLQNNKMFFSLLEEISKLTPEAREKLFKKSQRQCQPTWSWLGRISPEGQTEAGQKAQIEIAKTITNFAKDHLNKR